MPLTATVTGTVKDILNNPVPNAVVTIALWNYGNNVPTVSGGSIIVVPVITVKANGSGVFTAAPYGNDQITPAGTVYTVTFADSNSLTISTATYNFTSGNTYDLGVFAPNVTYPIPVAIGPVNATQLQGINIKTSTPTDGQVLTYVSADTKAEWQTPSGGSGAIPLHFAVTVFSDAQIRTLSGFANVTPVVTGRYIKIDPLRTILIFDPSGGAAYGGTASQDLVFTPDQNSDSVNSSSAGLLDQTVLTIAGASLISPATMSQHVSTIGAAYQFGNVSGAEYTGGNAAATLTVITYYTSFNPITQLYD